MDYGVAENIVEKLVAAGVGTIEKLGGMTPEELEAIQGVGPDMIERIFEAVNAYYGQFEEGQGEQAEEALEATAEAAPEAVAEGYDEASEQGLPEAPGEAAELQAEDAELPVTEPDTDDELAAEAEPSATLYDPESPEERFEPGSAEADSEQPETAEQFGNMEDAGSPTQNQSEGDGLEGEKPKGNGPRGGE
jgi:hypothetical protein